MTERENLFKTRETELNLETLDREIAFKIKQRQELGVYEHFDLTRVTHLLLRDIRDSGEFFRQHLAAIIRSWAVDINDFEIIRKQEGILGNLEVLFKKVIWKLLKFYTYRLFSQQIEFNSQIKNTVLAMHREFSGKMEAIEKEILAIKGKGR